MVVFDVTEPTMACTPCWLISRFAALLASVGSFLSSTIKVVIFLPAKPPLAFASSTAISNAFLTDSPNVFTSPESGVIRPILISFAGGVLQPGESPARRTAIARSDSLLLTSLLLSCAGFSVSALQFYCGFPCRQQFFHGMVRWGAPRLPVARRSRTSRRPGFPFFPFVGDPVDRTRLVVGDKKRPVGHHEEIHRASPCPSFRQPALREHLVSRCPAAFDTDEGYPISDGRAPVPRPVLRNEYMAPVLLRKHRPGVETHPEGSHMVPELPCRREEFLPNLFLSELRVGDLLSVPVRKTEVEPLPRCVVQFVGGEVVTEPVPPVVREPELLRGWVPVESDGVPHAAGERFLSGSVGPHSLDRGEPRIFPFADVAGGAYRNIEHSVQPECDELPSVMGFPGEAVIHHDRRSGILKPGLDAVEPEDAADLRHVQGAVPECHTVRAV